MYEKLLFPTKLDHRAIKNKVVAAPPPSFLCGKDGSLTPEFFNYYKNLAQQGAGILIVEDSAISENGCGWQNQCRISDNLNFLAISELVVKMRNLDILPAISLYHAGINAIPNNEHKVYGPSKIENKRIRGNVQPFASNGIQNIINEYKKAASFVWNAGFSAIEINASDGSLIHQFMSPITNRRQDEYAYGYNNGSLFLKKIIKAIKEVASDLAMIIKLSLRDLIPGGAGLKAAIEIANDLKELGISAFHINEGLKLGDAASLHPYLRNKIPEAPFAEDTLVFKTEVKSPVILSTSINTPEAAEKLLTKECCDFVSLSRILNREPEWIDMAITNQPIEFYKKCKSCMLCQAASKGCILQNID